MTDTLSQSKNYTRIARAIEYLHKNQARQPSLTQLAQELHLSEYHLQRLFTEWAGVSPKQFLQFLTKEHAKRQLQRESVLQASLNSGFSSASRLHDLMVSLESVTPGEYKRLGKGMEIVYGVHQSRFGPCFLAVTARGLCKLAFYDTQEQYRILAEELHQDWQHARIIKSNSRTKNVFEQIFISQGQGPIQVLLKSSPFRLQVWEALLKIPEGNLVSYQELARSIERPTAVRAVASAIASNPIGLLIPCHRVIRGTGAISQYRWGPVRKAAIIAWEQSALYCD